VGPCWLISRDAASGWGDGRPQVGYSLLAGPAAGTFASHTARALTEAGDHAGAEARKPAAFACRAEADRRQVDFPS
jgi:hypothetical protein